ncbi:MAG: MBL fold metallo-hydrolase [Actinomycetota bacterium]
MKCVTLFRRDEHRWLAFGQDPERPENVIDTNQYVICAGNSAMLLDPGGMEVFPSMVAALTHEVPVENVKALFFSHQDPDVGSSLPLWRRVCRPDAKVYLSWLWQGFVAHFDRDTQFTTIPDEGMEVQLAPDCKLKLIPAHYLHSPGNFNVYDPQARILFSGDIGAALVPDKIRGSLFVQDFNAHVQYMEGFHRRWMASTRARDAWVANVSKLDIDMLAPQHGLIFKGDDVKRFLDWFSKIEVAGGVASMTR